MSRPESRYDEMFARLGNSGAFGAFLMLGDPDFETCGTLLDACAAGGADMIEVGIPFSDPVADGPVIQDAAIRALKAGARVDDAFRQIAEFRARWPVIPIGILTYANLLAARGEARFMADAKAAGADSILIADVPSLEAPPYSAWAKAAGLDLIMIAAPNTPPRVVEKIAALSSGYTYVVARGGVTGTRADLALDHDALLRSLGDKGAPPAVLGFGISTPGHVRQALSAGARGVISGSAIVKLVTEDDAPARIESFVRDMKAATTD
ncbi:MAG: tryptophan synthase subunit alpha [Sphingomicrobium sp.]